jgi:aspartyl-tRNA(Asn)/glutamyl-tRNA(Gln) amidotransferase subunit A
MKADQPIHRLTGRELAERIQRKDVSSREAVEDLFGRIERLQPDLNVYLSLDREKALAQAQAVDESIAKGEAVGRLAGVPIAVKDNICTTDFPTTCASKILKGFRPPYDAHVVECLRREGAVIVGKTNLDEFAMGSSTENSAFGPTRNPWDRNRIPGGSSGGSAASIAADMAHLSVGSDTGGSIRQPAALCGCVGLKPTYGRVSRYGLIAFASSLDQIGPITKDVADAALLMEIIGNHDRRDSTSLPRESQPYLALAEQPLESVRIGIPKEYFIEGLDPEIEKAVQDAVKVMEKLGATIVDVSLPHTEYAVSAYYIVAPAEASSNLARYDGVHYGYRSPRADDLISMFSRSRAEGFGPEVQRRILLGTYALSSGYYDAYYLKASRVRRLIKRDFDEAFKQVDLLISPTTPGPAFPLGERADDPLAMYLADVFTIAVNMAGGPAISIPCGFTKDSLPIGLQIMADSDDEAGMLRLARAYERETNWRASARPSL